MVHVILKTDIVQAYVHSKVSCHYFDYLIEMFLEARERKKEKMSVFDKH